MENFIFWAVTETSFEFSIVQIRSNDNIHIMNRSNPPEEFLRKVVLKYAANLQENNHAEV